MKRRAWIAGAVGVALGGAVLLGLGPLVRARVAATAARYGAVITIAGASPEWGGVRLRGVDVSIPDIPGVRVWLDDVLVGWRGARPVSFSGGKIILVGSPGDLVAGWDRWRAARRSGGGGGPGRELAVGGFEVDWHQVSGGSARHVVGRGVGLRRVEGRYQLAAERLEARFDGLRLMLAGGSLTLVKQNGGYRLEEIRTAEARLEVASGSRRAAARVASAAERDAVRTAQALYHSMLALARTVDGRLARDARVAIRGARARLVLGGEALNLGPGTLHVGRVDKQLEVALEPDAEGGSTTRQRLTFSLRIPLGAAAGGGGEAVVASLKGGPLGLALLGVREGDLGLRDVVRTTLQSDVRLVLPATGRQLSISGRGELHALSLQNRRLAAKPLMGVDLAWRGKLDVQLDGSRVVVREGEVDLGDIRLLLRGSFERHAEGWKLDANFEVPLTGCASAFESLPDALVAKLSGTKMAGTFALRGHARFDTARLAKSFDTDWDAVNSCRVVQVPAAVDVGRLRRRFDKLVYDSDGVARHMDFGPETEGWVPRTAISHFMVGAVLTTEDGRFFRHSGFDKEAIVNSLRENLQQGRFVRGASTISMQLAKNLYLRRTKTIARKLQEAVLTTYLEQELTKDEIMELYLNVIEYGPMIYGIGAAARYYFNTTPSQLSLGQALYLASILADPKTQHFGTGGAVTPSYMAYLRKLMKIVHKIGRASEDELQIGLRETVVFGSPSPQLAPADDDVLPGSGAGGVGDQPLDQPADAGAPSP